MFDKIKNVEVYGLKQSVVASGYPMRTGEPERIHEDGRVEGYKKHMDRAKNLGGVKSGTGHDNFLKGIVVQFDMLFSQTMHRQILRYHFLDIVSSQSLMHRAKTGEMSFNKWVQKPAIELTMENVRYYNDYPTKDNFLRLIYNMPMGTEMWARFTTNYLQLKTVYFQRKSHKLPEWREFCEWVESLPSFKKYILGGGN